MSLESCFMLDQGSIREASQNLVSETVFGRHSCEQVKMKDSDDNKEVFDKRSLHCRAQLV
jgi:hypothetical protein